jgi:hypothetical protein
MSKIYPDYYIESQTSNSLIFKGVRSNFFGTSYMKFMFTFSDRVDEAGTKYTMVTLQPYSAVDSALVRDGYKPTDDAMFDTVLIWTCAINDGYYYYGFTSDGKKITQVNTDSPAYNAGLREGDKIKMWNSGGTVDYRWNSLILKRTPIFAHMKFVTNKGKTVEMDGVYISPEQALKELLS